MTLELITWEDTTNVAEWTPIEDIAEFAEDGGWIVDNVGHVVYEDDKCVVLAARVAFGADPPHAGLYERIPKRAILHRRVIEL